MENNEKEVIVTTIAEEQETVQQEQSQSKNFITIDNSKIGAWIFYILGIICLLFAQNFFFDDLELRSGGNRYLFYGETYVGGDAYNYIISAARSAAVMTRGLILAVCGCSFIIIGKLTAILGKLKK